MIKKLLSAILKYFPAIHRVGVNLYFKYVLGINPMPVSKFISEIEESVSYFVQIGANDGVRNDFIHLRVKEKNWNGILIEPISQPFNRLVKNYEGFDNIYFEKVAIVDVPGVIEMFKYDDKLFKEHNDQVSSMDKSHLIKHGIEESEIIVEQVPGITFSNLVDKHKLTNIDLLVVDAEGFDAQIILSIDFSEISIENIVFEHTHILRSDAYLKVVKKLRKLGYSMYRDSNETIATKHY